MDIDPNTEIASSAKTAYVRTKITIVSSVSLASRVPMCQPWSCLAQLFRQSCNCASQKRSIHQEVTNSSNRLRAVLMSRTAPIQMGFPSSSFLKRSRNAEVINYPPASLLRVSRSTLQAVRRKFREFSELFQRWLILGWVRYAKTAQFDPRNREFLLRAKF